MLKLNGLKKWSVALCGTLALACFMGCSDDSSSPSKASAEVPTSSAVPTSSVEPTSSVVPTSSDDPALLSSASDPSVVTESSSASTPATPVASGDFATTLAGAAPDADGFYDIGDVYKAAPATSKIAFVIRHSKREKNNLGQESTLTPIGIQMAQDAGAKLAGGDETFYYTSTDFVRTKETCRNIAIGRGEADPEIHVWDGIDGGYFYTVPTDTLDALMSKRGGSSRYIAQWAYGDPMSNNYVAQHSVGYFYDLFERGKQFINEVVVANMPNWKRVSILASHDLLVLPLIVYVSNRTIDLKIYDSGKWVNYLSGIAVIVDESGALTVLPIRGADVGYMIARDEVSEE